jgi:hypothetical protein
MPRSLGHCFYDYGPKLHSSPGRRNRIQFSEGNTMADRYAERSKSDLWLDD